MASVDVDLFESAQPHSLGQGCRRQMVGKQQFRLVNIANASGNALIEQEINQQSFGNFEQVTPQALDNLLNIEDLGQEIGTKSRHLWIGAHTLWLEPVDFSGIETNKALLGGAQHQSRLPARFAPRSAQLVVVPSARKDPSGSAESLERRAPSCLP